MASATPDVRNDAESDLSAPLADTVDIRVPADGAYLALLRTATAGLAARMDFTLDEIEDLRIAIDEAGALLLPDAAPLKPLHCEPSVPKALSTQLLSGVPVEFQYDSGSGAVNIHMTLSGDDLRISLHKQRGARL